MPRGHCRGVTFLRARRQPYTVVVDTGRPEASYCSCPVGVACKHLVAVTVAALSVRLPPQEIERRHVADLIQEDQGGLSLAPAEELLGLFE